MDVRWAARGLAVLAAAGLTVPPLAAVVWGAVQAAGGDAGEPLLGALWARTLGLALLAAAVATAVGAPAGVVLARVAVPGRGLWWVALVGPLLLPPYLLAEGWIDLLAPRFTPRGTVVAGVVLGLAHAPLPAIPTALAVARIPHALDDAARLYGARAWRWRVVLGPLLTPWLAASAALVALLALLDFAVPHLLQAPVFAAEVYLDLIAYNDLARAARAGGVLVLSGSALIAVAVWAGWRGRRWLDAHARAPWRSGAARQAAAVLVLTSVLLVTGVLPLLAMAQRVWPPGSALQTLTQTLPAVGIGVAVGASAATVAAVIALLATLPRAWPAGVLALGAAGYLASGPVLGVGLVAFWNQYDWRGAVYDHPAIMVLGVAAQLLPFAVLALAVARRAQPAAWEEAAAANGLKPGRTWARVTLPALLPALAAVWSLGFVLSSRSLDVLLLTEPPGYTPLAVRLFSLMHYGPRADVAVLALTHAAIGLGGGLLGFVAWRSLRRRFVGPA